MDDRARMLREIENEVRITGGRTGRHRLAPAVAEAMRQVSREEFVPAEMRAHACDNGPLPIGEGQTISQPFIVAIMTELLDPAPGHRVLEIGTGSGYQAAVLSRAVARVYSIEAIPELGNAAAERLERLGYTNVTVRIDNGRRGWPEEAPFDGIVVTAGADTIPPTLREQLAPGGRMVIPVGRVGQDLRLIRKDEAGDCTDERILPVAFVPLTG